MPIRFKRYSPKTTPTSFRLTDEMRASLQRQAKRDRRSVNQVANDIFAEHFSKGSKA